MYNFNVYKNYQDYEYVRLSKTRYKCITLYISH